jgi:hypothetical protein
MKLFKISFDKIIAFIWLGYCIYVISHYLKKYMSNLEVAPAMPFYVIVIIVLYITVAYILLKSVYGDGIKIDNRLKNIIMVLLAIMAIRNLASWVGLHWISLNIGRIITSIHSKSLVLRVDYLGSDLPFFQSSSRFFQPSTPLLLLNIFKSIPIVLATYSLATYFYGKEKISEYILPKRSIGLFVIPVFFLIKAITILNNTISTLNFKVFNISNIGTLIMMLLLVIAAVGIFTLIKGLRILAMLVSMFCTTGYIRSLYYDILFYLFHRQSAPELILTIRIVEDFLNILLWLVIFFYLTHPKVKERFT